MHARIVFVGASLAHVLRRPNLLITTSFFEHILLWGMPLWTENEDLHEMVAVHGYEQTALRTSSVAFFRLTQLVSFKMIHFWWSHNEYKILTERLICTTKNLAYADLTHLTLETPKTYWAFCVVTIDGWWMKKKNNARNKYVLRLEPVPLKWVLFLVNPQVSFSHQKT